MLTVVNLDVHDSFKNNYRKTSSKFAVKLYFFKKILQGRFI